MTPDLATVAGVLFGGQLLVVLAVLKVGRKYMAEIADARSREDDSPLGTHKADSAAHEAMREARIDIHFAAIRTDINALRSDCIKPMTDTMNALIAHNTRQTEMTERTVDMLAVAMQIRRHGDTMVVNGQNVVPK